MPDTLQLDELAATLRKAGVPMRLVGQLEELTHEYRELRGRYVADMMFLLPLALALKKTLDKLHELHLAMLHNSRGVVEEFDGLLNEHKEVVRERDGLRLTVEQLTRELEQR